MSSNSVEVLACKLNELAVGSMKELELNGRMILLSRSSDGVFATSHLCTHYGAPLIKGVINGNRVMCPWHGACFNLKQGDLEDSPGIDHLEHFDVKIKGDEIFVSVPLTSSSGKRRPDFACKKAISSKTVVVVGGGAAGYTAVETLRKEGFDGRVVLISSEEFLPYDRPKLSKNLSLSGEAIALRDRQFYDEIGVELVLGTSVEELDAATKLIKLSSGKTISYDDVIVCSGSRPFVIPIPGSNLEGVLTLRGPKEANHIDQLSLPDSKVIIIGTGFIGLELATYLKNVKKVKDVICVSQDKFPLARVFGDRIGAYLKGVYESNGVKLMLNTHLEEIIGKDGKVQSLKIKEQVEPLPCDCKSTLHRIS